MRNVSTSDLQANSDLLFCPFCGGEAHIKEVMSACENLYTVGCSDSECMGYETWLLKPTVDEAVAAWNRRAERTCHVDLTESNEPANINTWECSLCGRSFEEAYGSYEYCPHCGARIVEEMR